MDAKNEGSICDHVLKAFDIEDRLAIVDDTSSRSADNIYVIDTVDDRWSDVDFESKKKLYTYYSSNAILGSLFDESESNAGVYHHFEEISDIGEMIVVEDNAFASSFFEGGEPLPSFYENGMRDIIAESTDLFLKKTRLYHDVVPSIENEERNFYKNDENNLKSDNGCVLFVYFSS